MHLHLETHSSVHSTLRPTRFPRGCLCALVASQAPWLGACCHLVVRLGLYTLCVHGSQDGMGGQGLDLFMSSFAHSLYVSKKLPLKSALKGV